MSPSLLFVLVFSMILLGACVILVHRTTRRLLRRARHTAEIRWDLQAQLLHAAKMATVGEMAAGIAHEINNPLAIVNATNQTLRDTFDPRFRIAWTPDDIRRELDVIDGAVALQLHFCIRVKFIRVGDRVGLIERERKNEQQQRRYGFRYLVTHGASRGDPMVY